MKTIDDLRWELEQGRGPQEVMGDLLDIVQEHIEGKGHPDWADFAETPHPYWLKMMPEGEPKLLAEIEEIVQEHIEGEMLFDAVMAQVRGVFTHAHLNDPAPSAPAPVPSFDGAGNLLNVGWTLPWNFVERTGAEAERRRACLRGLPDPHFEEVGFLNDVTQICVQLRLAKNAAPSAPALTTRCCECGEPFKRRQIDACESCRTKAIADALEVDAALVALAEKLEACAPKTEKKGGE